MTCASCQHNFCFICLLPSLHLAWGYLVYGEPPEGYDDEGFERTPRGIHVLTGRNREGKNCNEMPNGIGPDSYEDSEDDDADADGNLFGAHYLAALEEEYAQLEGLHDYHQAEMDECVQQRNECLAERDEQVEQLRLDLQAISRALAPETDEHEADPGGLARYLQLLNFLDNDGEANVLVDAEPAPAIQELARAPAQDDPEPRTILEGQGNEGGILRPSSPIWEFGMMDRELGGLAVVVVGEGEEDGEEETEQEDTLDFGLKMMFDDEQTLHDKRHPTVKVVGSATSGMLQCSIAAHENPFWTLEQADEE
jgi:hypothetical protein